jgi:hypothetical protein
MKPITTLTTCTALLFAAAGPAACGQGWTCDYAALSEVDGVRKTETGRLILDGKDRFRWERRAGNREVIIVGMGVDVWSLSPETKTAAHARISSSSVKALDAAGQFLGRELDTFLKTGAKKIGTRKIDGQPFDVYQRYEKANIRLTLWVYPNGTKLTRRQETFGDLVVALRPGEPPARHRFLRQLDFTNWKPAKNLDAALFRPPPGWKITEGKGRAAQRPKQ